MEHDDTKPEQTEEIVEQKIQEKHEPKQRKKNAHRKKIWWWVFIFLFTFATAFSIGLVAEAFLQTTSVIICIVLIAILILIAFLGDIVAVAVAYADLGHFNAMASRKIRGAKNCIKLVKNSDKVSSILSDVLGDVTGIISGALGVSLAFIIIVGGDYTTFQEALIIALVTACIAAVTVMVKSIAKKIAIKNNAKIVFAVGRMLSLFTRR
ncbi:MAG: hypothetical protein FWE45_00980 [Firmicutes bacterium]|nr:hypothetical protein [Bacillota bacterium]